MADLDAVKAVLSKLIVFCKQHQRVFLYGAGKRGQALYSYLRYHEIQVAGFVITDGTPSVLFDCPIAPISLVIFPQKSGVILSFKGASEKNVQLVEEKGADVFFIPEDIFSYMIYYISIGKTLKFLPRRTKQSISLSSCKNVLVIRLDVIGDLITTIPFVRELHINSPNSHITLIVNKNNEALFRNCPYISELLLYPFENPYQSTLIDESPTPKRVDKFVLEHLNNRFYDIVFLPREILCGRNAEEELLLAHKSGANLLVGRMNGLEDNKDFLRKMLQDKFSLLSYETEAKHEVQYMLDMLKLCGGSISNEQEELWPSDVDRKFVSQFLPTDETVYIAIGLVGSTESRTWPKENHLAMIRILNARYKRKIKFVLLGGNEACASARFIMEKLDDVSAIDLTGKTDLAQAAAAIGKCRLYVGADTGLMHMAAAMAVPIVEISAALPDGTAANVSVPIRMGPWGVDYIALTAPHGLDECTGSCRRIHSQHCITQITVEEVVEAVEKFLTKIIP